MIAYKDLREWMEEADKVGELKSVKGANPKYEIGAIVEENSRNFGPAIIFDEIRGYAAGFRVLTNSMSNIRNFNLTFGFPIESSIRDTIKVLAGKMEKWNREADQFPPELVKSAPILENVKEGKDIDLNVFPVPFWHKLDGGPYIGTGDAIITADPDTGEVNMGTYRIQLHDKNTVGFFISPGKHGRVHRDKFFARGKPCPVVMVFGLDPLIYAISSNEVEVEEFNLIGAIRQEPMPIIKGKVTGLPIPAYAEIAIEGFSYPNELIMEGPFGEFTGYYGSGEREEPILRPSVLYYRNNPIIMGAPPGKGINGEHIFFLKVIHSALLWDYLNKAGIPNVMGVWFHPAVGGRELSIISIKQAFAGHATAAGHVASQVRIGAFFGKYVFVVDDDIDPYDIDDVLWALCSRSEPVEIDIIKQAWSTPLDPRIRKPSDSYTNSRAIIYGVKPFGWYNEFPPTVEVDPELRKEVLSKWGGIFGDRWRSTQRQDFGGGWK